ncbi:MAG TPA: riboflavin synthase [Terriglobia bacterium]|nr:riboflavin synthase [Terriglobia bacterium]
MFTGIIEEVGVIIDLGDAPNGFRRMRVRASRVVDGMKAGASIAVNGVCLTAILHDAGSFTADLSAETLARSSFGEMRPGALVNLERPMPASGRFDGHIVQGHVDGVGRMRSFTREADNWNLQVEFPSAFARYLVEKGSITVDGISLTVAGLQDDVFGVAIIPHTFDNTNLRQARAGDAVNLEFDVIAKYVERLIGAN